MLWVLSFGKSSIVQFENVVVCGAPEDKGVIDFFFFLWLYSNYSIQSNEAFRYVL